MSTKIKDAVCATDYMKIERRISGRVAIRVMHKLNADSEATAFVTHADFLAAVQSELHVRLVPDDAIVIERGELLSVDLTSEGTPYVGGQTSQSAEHSRDIARAHLALAEYLDAHPPVDEAQVKAIADIVRSIEENGAVFASTLARRLVEAGARIEVTR